MTKKETPLRLELRVGARDRPRRVAILPDLADRTHKEIQAWVDAEYAKIRPHLYKERDVTAHSESAAV